MLRLLRHVRGGIDAGEGAEIVNEMRLIEVAARERDVKPVNIVLIMNQIEHLLKTTDTAKYFRRESYLFTKAFYESPLAKTDFVTHF